MLNGEEHPLPGRNLRFSQVLLEKHDVYLHVTGNLFTLVCWELHHILIYIIIYVGN